MNGKEDPDTVKRQSQKRAVYGPFLSVKGKLAENESK